MSTLSGPSALPLDLKLDLFIAELNLRFVCGKKGLKKSQELLPIQRKLTYNAKRYASFSLRAI